MEKHERISAPSALAVCGDSYFMKTVRAAFVIVSVWVVIGTQMLRALVPAFDLDNTQALHLWSGWGTGAVASWLLYRVREPNPGNARLLGGLNALISVMLLAGRNVYLGSFVLGVSHALTICATADANWLNIWNICDTEENAASARHSTGLLTVSVLICCRMLCALLHMNHSFKACAYAASAAALAIIVISLRDPVDRRVRLKLDCLQNSKNGENICDAVVLQWLDERLVGHYPRAWVMPFLMAVVRLFLHYRVIHEDDSAAYTDGPVIYIANHGSVYGTIANRSYAPGSVRTWIISRVMADRREAAEYMYTYTFSTKRYIPKPLQRPVSKFMAWVMDNATRGLDAIPVFRDSPAQLRKTFSETVEAVRAGDDILIFPEDPNALGQNHGYEKKGVGSLYSGFAMLGQLLWMQARARVRFVPMFADRKHRTITFARPIEYDPANSAADERKRIADACEAELKRLAGITENAG